MNETHSSVPILYSFRRCPYAMRARMALHTSQQSYILREVALKNKPPQMLLASPKATVPILVLETGEVLDQSIDIMLWCLNRNDPLKWLSPSSGTLDEILTLIKRCETDFKFHLDRYKYANRYDNCDHLQHRHDASKFLIELENRLSQNNGDLNRFLFENRQSLADIAILPFVRQFAFADIDWFKQQPWPLLNNALETLIHSKLFNAIMNKYPPWQQGDSPLYLPISVTS